MGHEGAFAERFARGEDYAGGIGGVVAVCEGFGGMRGLLAVREGILRVQGGVREDPVGYAAVEGERLGAEVVFAAEVC